MLSKFFFVSTLFSYILFLNSCAHSKIAKAPDLRNNSTQITHFENGDYLLNFNSTDKWEVYSGSSPTTIDWKTPIATVKGKELLLPKTGKDKRIFFGIKSKKGKTQVVSEKRIPLKKQPNFRDLGGFKTKDGRYVKWGKIYRSGKLAKLKKTDIKMLKHLGIKTVCDFRSDVEEQKHPNTLPSNINYIRYPIGEKDGKSYEKLQKDVLKKRIEGETAKETFVKLMSIFADSVASDFQPVLDLLLADDEVPLVYHCSGGKDRTGFMSMIILSALDVDMQTIRNDYLMSNYYRQKANQKKIRLARIIGLEQSTLEYLFIVRDEYFDAALDTILDRYGDMDTYLEQKFGLTRAIRDQMKEKYTYE